MATVTLILLVAAVVCFVIAAVRDRSIIAAGLALWAGAELVGRL